MTSAVARRGAALPSLLKKLLAKPSASGAPVSFALRPAAVTAARRPYNTLGKEGRLYDDDGSSSSSSGESGSEYEDTDSDDRRRARDFFVPSFSQDVLDQFGAHTSLGRLLSALEDAAAPTGLCSTAGASRLGRWVAKVDDDAVYLKVPMPGLGKEHVKVWAEPNGLVIKGEGDKEPWDGDDDSAVPRYSRRIKVPADAFKMDKIKAEMKNGVLRVTLPRLKEEERKDVFQVKIE
ncbi:hypothetical protein CFC21_108205 [Triticum aestivum]|uniref:SHSP domain-containing protein n=2 Tax=Triticum aestivum TaxID=4565 RepID=A0A3B6TBR0_WHEAT|nr:26.2 kDa heat shock protein, mitochondrial-like [Triticum aestivum]KAF7107598.1 hypothetical protein CFC21_108205 [Triticum aestivum]